MTLSELVPRRVVVTCVGDGIHGRLAESKFVERPFLPGGERLLYEFAFAAAALGHDVELRGWLDRPTFDALARGAGVAPQAELPARRPTPEDLVVVPEGWRDPLDYARLMLSPARLALHVLAAPGLFGWPFIAEPWEPPDPVTVSLDELARPEHFRGMAAVGFRLLTHSPGIVDAARAGGVDCALVGVGRPGWQPPPSSEKPTDVIAIFDNRWAPLAERIARELDDVTIDRIETVGNEEMLARMSRARVLVWPSRVEGHATIPWEARSVGCVPVALSSNRFAVSLDDAHGAVLVDELDELAPAVRRLLSDSAHWEELSRRGRATSPADVDWEAFVARVAAFLAEAEDRRSPVGAPLTGIGKALDTWLDDQAAEREARRTELAVAARDLTHAMKNQERMTAEIDHWRAVYERSLAEQDALAVERNRLDQENHEFRAQMNALRVEKDRVTRELRALRDRRSVRAALRVADTVKRKDA